MSDRLIDFVMISLNIVASGQAAVGAWPRSETSGTTFTDTVGTNPATVEPRGH